MVYGFFSSLQIFSRKRKYNSKLEAKVVVLLRPEEVPKGIIYTICLSVPSTPCTLRSCSHVFCENCIRESISHQKNCPVCRRYCSLSDVQSLEEATTLGYRIWNGIMVKCNSHESGCSWTGSISDYRSHKHSCPQQDKRARRRQNESAPVIIVLVVIGCLLLVALFCISVALLDLIGSLEQVNFDLESILGNMEVKYRQLKDELDDFLLEISTYDSFYVPKVAVLICQNLQDGLILNLLKYAIVFDVYTLI